MKYLLQWKDPDFVNPTTGKYPQDTLPEDEYGKLRALGAGEYIIIEFDTELGTTRVIPPHKR